MTDQPEPPAGPWDGAPTGFSPPGYSPDGAPEPQQYAATGYPGPYVYPYGPYGYFPKPPTNTLAILALVLSFVVAPAGFVLGIIALRQINRSGEDGRGLAVAGLTIGAVLTGIFVLYVIFIMFVLFALSGV